jgi:hypothetical protein
LRQNFRWLNNYAFNKDFQGESQILTIFFSVTWISSDDDDQYSITREEIHDNNRILVGSFYPKVQHKYSQKHYHKILICNYLTQSMKYSVIIMDFFTCDWILIVIIGTNSCNTDLHYFYKHIADSDSSYQFVPFFGLL